MLIVLRWAISAPWGSSFFFWCIIAFPLHLNFMKLTTPTPHEVDGVFYWCQGQKVKVKVNALITKNGFWRITAFYLQLQSSNITHRFPVSPGYALILEFELVASGGYFSCYDSPILDRIGEMVFALCSLLIQFAEHLTNNLGSRVWIPFDMF